jgi:hypothetical protein
MTAPTDPPESGYTPPRAPLWGTPDPAGGDRRPARPLLWDGAPGPADAPAGPHQADQPATPLNGTARPLAPPHAAGQPPVGQPAGGQPAAGQSGPGRWAGRGFGGAWAGVGLGRGPLVAIAVIVLLAVSTVVVVAVRSGSSTGAAASSAAAPPVAPPGAIAGDPNGDSTLDQTEDPTPTTEPTTEEPTPAPTGSVPAGYQVVTGPAGVEVPVPESWPVKPGAVPSNLQADDPAVPGRFLRFGGDPVDGSDPVATVRGYEADTPSIRAGYHRIRLEPVAYGPSGLAVDWEFTFVKDGQTRHAYGRYWYDAGTLYVVYLSAYDSDWAASTDVLQVVMTYSGPS